MPILNIAAYHFSEISNPEVVRDFILNAATALDVKGTILVTPEGLNAFLAGEQSDVHHVLRTLRTISGFEQLQAKESWSDTVPFQRFKVKLKREIIRMDHPTIRPAQGRAPAVDAQTLARWLDQGHDDQGLPVVMLDTRNDFEVDEGAFHNAIDWRIQKFTQFPEAAKAHAEDLRGKTVVSYCTGGIRCEKAAIFMHELGLTNVLQLEGGILKYFEQTDGRHFQGGCFVFDDRRLLDPALQPTPLRVPSAS
ncbi:MAG: hypothetical protein RLZZ290_1426 [Pseudomonadota bacterium]|jgi:UPF0176 protein